LWQTGKVRIGDKLLVDSLAAGSAYPDKSHAREQNFPQVEVMALFLIRKVTGNLREIAITIYNPLNLLLNKILNKFYSR